MAISETTIEYFVKDGRKTKIVGLNQYKALHWTKLKQKIDPLKKEFTYLLLSANIPPLKWMELRIEHNTNFDLDNITGTIKVFVDCLRAAKVIKEDDRRFWDFLSIKYNPELKKNYLTFNILGEKLD